MIDIKSISSEILFSVLITEEAEHVEELMKSDHVALSWNSELDYTLPAGAYIEYKGEKYSLLEPYRPIQENENKFVFTPEFQSVIMRWAKIPFFMYTYAADNVITSRESDWSLTDTPASFMSVICKAIKNETGEEWTFSVDASLPASATVSFQSTDIFSGLNAVANIFKTEWWADKANRVLHLSKAEYGIPVTLEVGENINVPSVTDKKEGYYTRFYAFGSTRNIVQDYKGANVNNIANKRLTLDPTKYPGGYKDIKPGLQKGEIFSKILVFDDVYPSSKLTISDVRVRLMWTFGDDNEKVQIGTDEAGNPVYDQYAIWYFRIQGFTLNNTTYDKDSNPDGMLILGKELSAHFETGALQGREFELIYHEKTETVSSADGTSIVLNAGDYEIKFKEESSYIIPAITALIPSDGDKVILFNIRMPQEYVNAAYSELEEAMDKEIAHQSSDLNNYEFDSNPVAFYENNPNLSVGQKVTYINGDYSYSTRVIKLVTRLDYDIRQRITIGNDKITGTIQELKEDVSSANKDVNLLAEINNMTSSLQQSYQRTQKLMQEGFAAIKNMWRFDPDTPNTIYSIYNVYSLGAVSALGLSNGGSSGGGGASYSRLDNWPDYTADKAGYVLSAALGYDLKTRIDNLPTTSVNPYALTFGGKTYDGSQAVTLTAADLGALTTHQIIYSLTIQKNGTAIGTYSPATQSATINISDVASAATLSSHTGNSTIHITAAERTKWNTTSSSLDSIMGTDSDTIINKWEEVVAFLDTYTEADTLAGLLGNKADKTIKISAGQGLSGGGDLSSNRTLSLKPATTGTLGGVIVGNGLAVDEAGLLVLAYEYSLPTASASTLGGVKVGPTLEIDANGVLNQKANVVTAETYPKVAVDTFGRVIGGSSLAATDIPSLPWSKITSGKPTTLLGYGITDAYTKTEINTKLTDGSVTKVGTATVGSSVEPIYLSNGAPTVCGYSFGNASGNAALNNGTLNTNLNADLLDGYHKESFDGYKFTQIDASELDNDVWYPVIFTVPVSKQTRVRVEGLSTTNASWNSRTDKQMAVYLDYTVQGSGWGFVAPLRVVHFFKLGAGASSSNCVAGLGQLGNSSKEYVMVRGGAFYNFYISHWITPVLYTSTYTANNQSISPVTTSPTAIVRNSALISDNVNSATKLQTARTLWGQSFNGTANVSGALTEVTDITMSGKLTIGPVTITYDAANKGLKVSGGGLYSDSYITALGVNPDDGSSGSGGGSLFGLMRAWPSDAPGSSTTDALGANLGWELHTKVTALEAKNYLDALNLVQSGSGNAVTAVTLSADKKTLTVTKGTTFLTAITKAQVEAVLTGDITSHTHSQYLTAHQPLDYLNIKDVRGETRLPSYFADKKLTAWFNNTGMPSSNWFSGIHMRGWAGSYASWELASTAADSDSIQGLYFRVGRSDTWQSWQTVLTSLNTKISGGVITINGTSITPLTTHQSVSDKAATLAWDSAVTIATVGSTNITVKLPANPNTDTKNTAGSTDTSSKLYLIGATSQAANPQTYSHDTAYIGTDGCLYSGGAKVLTSHQSLANYVTLNSAQTITGLKTFTQSIHLKHSDYSTGGNAKMIVFDDYQDNAVGSFGSLATNNVFQYIYAGWGTAPWNLPYCLAISSDRFTYKNNDVLHVGNYADTLDTRYALKSSAMTFTDGTNYVAARFNNASLALLAYNTYIEFWQSNAGWFNLKAGKFMVDGGTSSHFLKGDGSLDNNSYATVSQLTDGSVTKIGTQHVGSVSKGIYLNAGVPTAMTHSLAATVNAGTSGRLTYYSSTTAIAAYSSTVGDTARPMYLNAGVPTGLSANVGNAAKPIFLSAGTLTACSSTVGGVAKPVYLNAGEITACSSTVGSASLPVYMSAGTLTACGTSLAVSITGNAASATYASNVRISTLNPTSKTAYYLNFTTGISSGTNYPLYGNNGIRYQTLEGTTDSLGIAELLLGNSATSGTAGNKYGAIRLYATTDGYTSYRTYNAAGRTLYLVGAANSVAVGSSLKPVYVSSAGVVTAFSNTIGSATTPVYVNAGTITNCSYSFGNNSGNVPISNGTLNTNLNANYLNGLEESRFFLTNRGTIPTAFVDLTTSTSGNANYANYSSGTYSIQSSSSTELFINFALNTGSTSALQLKTGYSTANTLYYRKTIDANRVSGDWSHFITSENIASQTVSKANSLVTARTIWGQSFNGSANVSGALSNVGNITPAANATYSCGTAASRWSSVYASNYLYVGATGLTSPNSGVSGCVLSSEGCLELIGGKYAYIDFHYDGSTSDYTNRIIEGVSGQLTVTGSLRIGLAYAISSSYKFYVAGTAYISSTLKVASTADYASSSAAFSTTGSIFASKNIYADGAITAKASSSDIRLKKDLCEYDALDMIRSFRSVKYKWNDVAKRNSEVFNTDAWQFGLIAQDLIKGGYRQLTSDVFKDYLTIQYERLTPVLWRGVQQIDEEITQLKKRIEELEKKAKTNTRFTKTNIRYK